MSNLSTNSDFPVGNAAGWCKSVPEVENLARSAASFVVVGSITIEARSGNPGNTFNGELFGGLNSLGLPNPGIEKIREIGPEMVRIAHAAQKPIIMSAAGFASMEYAQLARAASEIGFDGVEINIGCPNVIAGGKRKPIASYNGEVAWKIVNASMIETRPATKSGFFVSVKVSPMDPERLEEIASILEDLPINAIVTQNTVPNCLDYRSDGKPLIDTPDKTGYAGGSGKQIFQQTLGQVKQWRARLPERIAVWGVGGVQDGEGVRKMLWAGASVVQVGTAYFAQGPKIFSEIATQFMNREN